MRKLLLLFLVLVTTLSGLAEPAPQLPEKGGYETWLTVSKDGRYLAVNHSTTVSVWDVAKKSKIHTMKGFERVSFVGFTPDAKSIVVADYPRWIGYFDLTQGFQKRWTYKAPWSGKGSVQGAGSYGIQFSPDGKTLLAADSSHGAQAGDDVVRLISAADGRVLSSHPKWAGRPYRSELGFVDNDTFARARHDKLQLYSIGSGKKLAETRLGGNVFNLRGTDPRGLLCRHHTEGGSKLVERLYSKSDLSLLRDLGKFQNVPTEHPDGKLRWKGDSEVLISDQNGEVVFQGSPGDTLAHWAPGGRFVIETLKDRKRTYALYDASGKKLGPVDFGRYFPNAAISVSITGYGSPCSIFDLTRGTTLTKLDFASDAEMSDDGNLLAVLMQEGILLVDVRKTLKTGELVLY